MNLPILQRQQQLTFADGSFPVSIQFASRDVNEQFEQLVVNNPELSFEQKSTGEILVMLPTGGKSGWKSLWIGTKVTLWACEFGGITFDSSTIFRLPNGAKRSPDCSWVSEDRWRVLTDHEQEVYPPLAPDFVIELRSKTDRLAVLQEKMLEFAANGVRLGWLIDPMEKRVRVYRIDSSIEILESPASVSEPDILPGFVLDLSKIWT